MALQDDVIERKDGVFVRMRTGIDYHNLGRVTQETTIWLLRETYKKIKAIPFHANQTRCSYSPSVKSVDTKRLLTVLILHFELMFK